MNKQTKTFLVVIGILSVLAGVYAAYRSGEVWDAVSGVFIGIALIGTAIIEYNKTQDKNEL